jgi:hypothetical protein
VVTTLAFAQLVALVIAPCAIWHRVMGDIFASFRWDPTYMVSELTPWLLLIVGVAFLVPVAVSVGRNPESRLYPRARRAYIAWGTVLYLLGVILAIQVTEVWHYTT